MPLTVQKNVGDFVVERVLFERLELVVGKVEPEQLRLVHECALCKIQMLFLFELLSSQNLGLLGFSKST